MGTSTTYTTVGKGCGCRNKAKELAQQKTPKVKGEVKKKPRRKTVLPDKKKIYANKRFI